MRIAIITTSTNNTNTVIDSLAQIGLGQIDVLRYDSKWNQECLQAINVDPEVRTLLQMGAWPPPEHREAFRPRVQMDEEMLEYVRDSKPDLVIYISAWEGLFVPKTETLGQINAMSPLIHLCFDGADPPWWPQMKLFEELGVFSLTVNIDGGQFWPGGNAWIDQTDIPRLKKSMTTLTPLDPRAFTGVQVPFMDRPYSIGYAGNAGGWIRSHFVTRLQKEVKAFTYRPRDDHPQSYKIFCDFLRHCKAVISIPFTGSNATKHVKGRVIETGFAGAALMEYKNDATSSWFIPRFEYWEYDTIEEGLESAEYLAGHPKLCQDMARALHYRCTTQYSAENIWKAVFNAVGVDPIKEPTLLAA